MSKASEKASKVFTVEDANRMLPLVSAIVSDWVSKHREISERRERLDDLKSRQTDSFESSSVYRSELAEVERELHRDSMRLREYLEELRQLGVQPHGTEGEVVFPSEMDGRAIMLSWKLGEPEVMFWHDVDSGDEQRQPLAIGGCDLS